MSQRRGGTSRYFLADGQGSIRQLTDSVGAVSDTYFYTAFGDALASIGASVNSFKYVGEQLDANSGFYYNRARWMDPKVGQFLSVDPFEGIKSRPSTLHRYLYSNASPINFSDPSGELYIGSPAIALTLNGIIAQATLVIGGTLAIKKVVESWDDALLLDMGPSPSGEEQPGLAAMRIQFQSTTGGKTKNHSRPAFNSMDYGVTKLQALTMLHNLQLTTPSWWLGRLGDWTRQNVILLEEKIMSSDGVGPGFEYFYRQSINISGSNYRIDMENLRGKNLVNLN